VRSLGTVAIVILGLAVMMAAVGLVANSFWMLQASSLDGTLALGSIASFFAGAGLLLVGGYYLVAKRHVLAERLFGVSDDTLVVEGQTLLRVGLIIVGVVWVLGSIPRWLSTLTMTLAFFSAQTGDTYLYVTWPDLVSNAVAGAIELGVGVLFVVRSEAVASRLWDLGSARHKVQAPEPTALKCSVCGAPYDPAEYRDMETARCAKCGSMLHS
jgi:hypothetical protein